MTPFKKSKDVHTPLMVTKNDTIIRLPNGDLQVDPQGRKAKVDRWFADIRKDGEINYEKFSNIVSKDASRLMVEFFHDMYIGKNMAKGKSKKPRSANCIFGYRTRLPTIVQMLEKHSKKTLLELTEDDVLALFNGMRDGIIYSQLGKPFKDSQTYAKYFASFWRWRMRVMYKQRKECPDIVHDLDLSRDKKPKWIYFDFEKVKEMADMAPSLYYKALVLLNCYMKTCESDSRFFY